MANRQRGEVGHEVEGKRYTLKPVFDWFCEVEDLTGGKGIDDLMKDLASGRLSGLRAVTWCLLQEFHRSEIKTLRDASDWIEKAGGAGPVLDLVQRCLKANEPEGEGKADPPSAQDGTGEPSMSEPAVLA